MKSPTCFLVAILITGAASGADTNWQKIKTLPGQTFYIDRASVRVEDESKQGGSKEGDKRKVKTLSSYDTEQVSALGERFLSESYIDIFSCSKRTTTLKESTKYAGKLGSGKVIRSSKIGVSIAMAIVPGSVNDYLLEMLVCN